MSAGLSPGRWRLAACDRNSRPPWHLPTATGGVRCQALETNLIGVTVVVLAVNFMGAVSIGDTEHLLQYGAGIALPIAALGLFVGLRAWSVKLGRESASEEDADAEESPVRWTGAEKAED